MSPPRRADALLERLLPEGPKGLTIVADLHEEFRELAAAHGGGAARRWYWREAIALGLRYAGLRAIHGIGRMRPGRGEGMASLVSDLKFGLRMLARTPGLSLVAVVTVGLGVGLTTHTWSMVDGSVLRGPDVPGAERLVMVVENDPARGRTQGSLPVQDFEVVRARASGFEDVAAYSQGTVNVAGEEGPPERFAGAFVSANLFDLVGVAPILGRTFAPGEDRAGAEPRAVLAWHSWQSRFGGDPDVVGRTIRANGESAEVIGVMPEGFRFPFLEDMWLPLRLRTDLPERRTGFVDLVAKLAEGVDEQAAQASLDAVTASLAESFPETNAGLEHEMVPFVEYYMPPQIIAVMFLMLAATVGVLMIACANIANLLLARATLRAREVAVRTALGAGRFRLVRQLLLEAFVLSAVGGVIGVGIAWVGADLLSDAIADIEKPYWIAIRIDGPALAFALGATLLASLAAGTVPALRASGFGVGEILRDEGRGATSLRLGRFSSALVIGEVAVSCGLLIAAGLMIKSVANLRTLDMGFDPAPVLTGRLGLFATDYPEPADRRRFFEELERRIAAMPGVTSAAVASQVPGLGGSRWAITVEGDAYASDRDRPIVHATMASAGFLQTVGVPLLRGRDLTAVESWDSTDPVALVNKSFVRTVLGGRDPLGLRLRLGGEGSTNPFHRVVGVIPDLHVGGGVGGLGDDRVPPEHVYLNPAPYDVRFMTVMLRTEARPAALVAPLRTVIAALDPDLPVYELAPLDEAIERATWAFGLFGSMFTIFGVAALFMAAVGLYGVMSFSVGQRRQEMGVRMALGAAPARILRLVLGRGARQLALGTGAGLALGWLMARPLRAVTYGVESGDLSVYAAIVGTLALAGLLATIVPARAATRADPAEAMRPR